MLLRSRRLAVARRADLAVAWGELRPASGGPSDGGGQAVQASGGWLRVWSFDPRERVWRILVEVVLPPPQ